MNNVLPLHKYAELSFDVFAVFPSTYSLLVQITQSTNAA